MRRPATVSLLLCLSMALSGCGLVIGHAIREGMRKKQEESQVVASLARYRQLVIAVDSRRLADMFVEDGELSNDTETPHVGQGQIRAFLESRVGYKVQDFVLSASSTTSENETATQRGTYAETVLTPDGKVSRTGGGFYAVWRHQSDGRWLLARMHMRSGAAGAGGG